MKGRVRVVSGPHYELASILSYLQVLNMWSGIEHLSIICQVLLLSYGPVLGEVNALV